MDTIVQDALQDAAVSQKDSAKLGPTWTTAAFLSAVTWSLGGGLTAASKDTFSDFFRRLAMGGSRMNEALLFTYQPFLLTICQTEEIDGLKLN